MSLVVAGVWTFLERAFPGRFSRNVRRRRVFADGHRLSNIGFTGSAFPDSDRVVYEDQREQGAGGCE